MTRKENEMIAIKLNAGNDRNGNPRRVFVVMGEGGSVLDAIDEGYSGISAFHEKYPDINEGWSPREFETTPREYKEILKKFRA
jgi:hypothetical protein